MNIATETHDNRMLTLTVEVEPEQVQPALRAAARRMSQRYRLPGFRPGKAPYDVLVRHVGESAVYQEAIETDLGPKVYEAALDEAKVDAFAAGELIDLKLKPLVLTFKVPLRPEVTLGDYRAVRVPYTPPAVDDTAVEEHLEHLREHHAVLEPVDRAAALNDVATIDVSGHLNEGLNPSDILLKDSDVALLLDEKADWPLPGFAPLVVGIVAGETRKFDLAFPADYPNEALRGQLAHFEVVCKEVKSRQMPAWSDDLAKEMGDYESLADLREKTRAELAQRAESDNERTYHDAVVKQVMEQATINYPPMLLDAELDELLDDLDKRLREQNLTLEDYMKAENKTKEELREQFMPQALHRLKRSLVLGKVIDLEQLQVTDDEITTRINYLSDPWGDQSNQFRQMFSSERARRMIALDLLTDKSLKRLAQIARGEEVPALAAAPAA